MQSADDFARLTDSFRPELLAHCYRMLGSVHDAEDQVQETMLRAWRSYTEFEGRASLRTWLYRIATNTCLRALETRGRRPLPSGLRGPGDDPDAPPDATPTDVSWLQPIPDAMFTLPAADPATTVASRASMRLALIAALQYLPARQRAVLLLRDVLGWRAAEVAETLGTTTAAVNSTLQRARAQLQEVSPAEDEVYEPADPQQRALLDRYATAFENADIPALMQLLRDDAVLEMPPQPMWFTGRQTVGRFLAVHVLREPGQTRLLATVANGQPALATYWRGDDGDFHPHGVQVLTFAGASVARIVSFNDAALIATFGLPSVLAAAVAEPR
jgi:RNA polymerase sigma-70 factor (ECF subfamily)